MVTRRPGFTIVEVALVMTLTMALMTLMTSYFVAGQHYAAETEAYSSVQRAASNLMRTISDDLYRSTTKHLDVSSDSVVFLSFGPTSDAQPRLEVDTNTGAIVWKKWVGYYLDSAQQRLYRAELPLTSKLSLLSDDPTPLASALGFPSQPGVRPRPLPGKVSDFSISASNRRVRIRLSTVGEAPVASSQPGQRDIKITVAADVAILN